MEKYSYRTSIIRLYPVTADLDQLRQRLAVFEEAKQEEIQASDHIYALHSPAQGHVAT